MKEFLKNISSKDLEKLKMLLSFLPGNEQKEIITLRVLIDEYLNLIKQNRSKPYFISVECSFKHLINFFGIHKSVREIGLKEIENFCFYLQQNVKHRFRSSGNNYGYLVYWRTLKAAFNKAKEWGYVSENYFTKVKLPKRQKLAPVFINSEQLSTISDQVKNEIVKDVVVFAFYTGMRLNEIVNLRWKNVDLNKRIITVGDDKYITKGRNQRFIPICDEALEVLLRKKTPSRLTDGQACVLPIDPLCPLDISPIKKGGEFLNSYVFCKANGVRFTGDYISKIFKMACKAASLDNAIHFHSLRHSFASNLVQRGVPLYTIKELLGHSSISTTEIYSHLNMESLREAIKKLDNRPHPDPLLSKEREKFPLQIIRINSVEK